MYTWIVADLLAGMAVGAVGSETKLPTRVGELPSIAWWSLPRNNLYAGLQSHAKYYNQYSAALNPISDASGFAYTDRFKYTTMSLAPVWPTHWCSKSCPTNSTDRGSVVPGASGVRVSGVRVSGVRLEGLWGQTLRVSGVRL